MPDRTKPSSSTRNEERQDAKVPAQPDREPTAEEAAAAESNDALDPEVAESYEEMAERGAHQRGEGQIT